jgi:carboxypeptidase Q
MMGAHIDSWHGGTGATDNATGVAVMMEAARILKTIGITPRRTIRIALWGGEEEGLLGSQAYVRDHFGTFESPRPEYSVLSAYINLDAGTGRVRGASVFGPSEAAAVLREILEPFKDLGVVGANSVKARSHGGTDSTSFNWAGLAGINLLQDPIEYNSYTWHTDLDTYERVLEPDLKQCAIVVASTVYHLAMRDELLPRFSAAGMPSPEK